MTFISFNVQGSLNEKLKDVSFIESVFNYDVVMLCESWTNEMSDVDVEGYIRISKVRKRKKYAKRSSGGLEVYIKEELIKGVEQEEYNHEDGLKFKFDKDFFGWQNDLYLFFLYFKPIDSSRNDLDNGNDCFDTILNGIAKVQDKGDILIAGDLNSRIGVKQDILLNFNRNDDFLNVFNEQMYEHVITENDLLENGMSIYRANSDKGSNDYGPKLIQLCNTCDMAVLNGRAGKDKGIGKTTFCGPKGESTVDFVLCSKNVLKYILKFEISDHVHFSDHKMVMFSVKSFININSKEHPNTNTLEEKRFSIKWDKDKKSSFEEYLNTPYINDKVNKINSLLDNNIDTDFLDSAVEELSNVITEAGAMHKKSINSKKSIKTACLWYDGDCISEKNKFIKRKIIFLNNSSDENRLEMCRQRNIYRQLCRRKKRLFNREKAEQLVTLSKTDSKLFWRQIKGADSKKTNMSNIDFHKHFKHLSQRDAHLSDGGNEEVIQLFENNNNSVEFLDAPITMKEVDTAIKDLKKGKSAGHDSIINEFLIHASLGIKILLLTIFNNILTLEYFPNKWCVGSIVPIFKSGNEDNANNYRGITLMSVVGKLFTKIMNTRLNNWAEKEHILTESQFGFRKGRGTTDCLFILHGIIENMLNNGNKLFVAFIDYEKAFDYLDRGAIWAKLIKSGVSSKCIRIFQSMYNKIKLEVKHESKDGLFQSNAGILQGECTSPIFFSFFVNDLESSLDPFLVGVNVYDMILKLLMYADDMTILSETKEGLQKGLNDLNVYCNKWGISVNTRKTKIVVFEKRASASTKFSWFLKNEKLEVVPVFKYLGLHISGNGLFSKNVNEVLTSARRALFGIKRIIVKNDEILPKMQLDLFNSMVSPILSYGCEVWGFCKADPIERFYLSFLKCLLCVKRSTPNCFIYGELGVFPLQHERKLRILKYWFKILKADESSHLKKVYYDMLYYYQVNPQNVSWVKLLRTMLYENGFGYVWEKQSVTCETSFLNLFKQRLQDIAIQNWVSEVNLTTSNKLYKHVKIKFQFEGYLNMSNKCFRSSITSLRMSSHLFYIERGRWAGVEVKDRICEMCHTIEDEYHCLVECPRFSRERKGLLPHNLIKKPSMFNFIEFIKCQNKEIYNKIGLLCFKIMKAYRKDYTI